MSISYFEYHCKTKYETSKVVNLKYSTYLIDVCYFIDLLQKLRTVLIKNITLVAKAFQSYKGKDLERSLI